MQAPKKLFALAVVALLMTAATALANDPQTQRAANPDPEWIDGTIVTWDDATKNFKVKDSTGKEISLTMDANTKVHGTGKVGEPVRVKTKKDRDGNVMATQIFIGREQIDKAPKGKAPGAGQ